jgi:hypothetical protein
VIPLSCNSFRVELLRAVHDFTAGTGDTFKLALYTSSLIFNASITNYTAVGESSGVGYTAGGVTLTSVTPVLDGSTAVVDFSDANFGTVLISYRYALLYNSTKANRAVAVFDFGATRVISGGDLIITMPPATATNAIVRVGG